MVLYSHFKHVLSDCGNTKPRMEELMRSILEPLLAVRPDAIQWKAPDSWAEERAFVIKPRTQEETNSLMKTVITLLTNNGGKDAGLKEIKQPGAYEPERIRVFGYYEAAPLADVPIPPIPKPKPDPVRDRVYEFTARHLKKYPDSDFEVYYNPKTQAVAYNESDGISRKERTDAKTGLNATGASRVKFYNEDSPSGIDWEQIDQEFLGK